MDNSGDVFFFSCPEPKGRVLRVVRPMEYKDLRLVYQRIAESHKARGRFLSQEVAVQSFSRTDRMFWIVDDVGIIFAGTNGECHIFFWDKRLRGREVMCYYMCRIALVLYNLPKLWTEIPRSARAVIAFAKRVGFLEVSSTADTITLEFLKGAANGHGSTDNRRTS